MRYNIYSSISLGRIEGGMAPLEIWGVGPTYTLVPLEFWTNFD